MSTGKKVITVDGAADGAGMDRWEFSGHPNDMYEHRGEIGELRQMTVIVECTGVGTKQTKDGSLNFTKWAVRNATIGGQVQRPDGSDPNQGYLDDELDDANSEPRADYGDYNPGSGEDFVPPAGDLLADERDGRAPENVKELFSDSK